MSVFEKLSMGDLRDLDISAVVLPSLSSVRSSEPLPVGLVGS